MKANQPGRIRIRLSEILLANGIIVAPEDLWTQEGSYRHTLSDLARWGTSSAKWILGVTPDGTPLAASFSISSWSTMTRCVRHGISLSKEDKYGSWYQVSVESKL